jgi:CRISPR-associated protein Csx17
MSEDELQIDWSKTTFDGSRREQLRRWLALTVRQRLEALDRLSELAHRSRSTYRSIAGHLGLRRRRRGVRAPTRA